MSSRSIPWAPISVCIFLCLAVSCSEEDSPSGPAGVRLLYFDEAIILESSSPITPAAVDGDHLVFDLSGDSLLSQGKANDMYLRYPTPGPGDEEHQLFNVERGGWDVFVPHRSTGFSMEPGGHGHMLSGRGLNLEPYVSESNELWVRPWFLPGLDPQQEVEGYEIRMLSLNSAYRPIYFPDYVYRVVGMTWGEGFYWMVTFDGTLMKVSPEGVVVKSVSIPVEYPQAIAYGGGSLWLSDGPIGPDVNNEVIVQVDQVGGEICRFSVPTESPAGLAWADNHLWLAETGRDSLRLLDIDPAASCLSGTAVVDNSIIVGKPLGSLAWDGTNLLAAGDSLYRITLGGAIIRAYGWTVGGNRSVAWADGALNVLCSGPRELPLSDELIVKFKMR